MGSDPCNKNKKLQTPYAAANDKKTRNTFRRFMEVNPDKFSYQKVLFTAERYINISTFKIVLLPRNFQNSFITSKFSK